jgi:hypothetical protein
MKLNCKKQKQLFIFNQTHKKAPSIRISIGHTNQSTKLNSYEKNFLISFLQFLLPLVVL